jgi:hypothetical protein
MQLSHTITLNPMQAIRWIASNLLQCVMTDELSGSGCT